MKPGAIEGSNFTRLSLPDNTQSSKADIARLLDVAANYNFSDFLPTTIEPGVNFPTAIALIQAIDEKGQTQGWNQQDFQLVLPATYAALTTAGFGNTKAGLEALLTGSTGNLDSIMKTIIPEGASKAITFATKAVVRGHQLHNVGRAISLLVDEKKIETRLLQLAKLQRTILLDPAKTRALLDLLNLQIAAQSYPRLTNLPETTETALTRISPFSLEDMKVVNGLFNAVEKYTDSRLQIGRNTLLIKTEGEKLRAAGIQLGQIGGNAAAATTEAILRISGGLISGAIGGTIKGGDEMIWQIRQAIEVIKERNKTRKFSD